MLSAMLRYLLPGSCLLCDGPIPPQTELDLCGFCLEALPWNRFACPRCAEPMAADQPLDLRGVALPCARCRRQPPPFTVTLAPLRYEGFAQAWVGRLKDHLGMVEGQVLGTLLADAAEAFYRGESAAGMTPPQWLIPVPVTVARLARRGHNQAVTLARPVARRLNVPLLRRAVVRPRSGRRQRGLSRPERLENPTGRFASRRSWHDSAPCIGIVDDVMTTGATAAELARVLLAAGAGEVHVLAATRTPPQRGS
jgi:predicted amidophosphoribosyltransferase